MAPTKMSEGQWTPTNILEIPIKKLEVKNKIPSFLLCKKTTVPKAKKKEAWPEGKEPLASWETSKLTLFSKNGLGFSQTNLTNSTMILAKIAAARAFAVSCQYFLQSFSKNKNKIKTNA